MRLLKGGSKTMGSVTAWILEGFSNFISVYKPCAYKGSFITGPWPSTNAYASSFCLLLAGSVPTCNKGSDIGRSSNRFADEYRVSPVVTVLMSSASGSSRRLLDAGSSTVPSIAGRSAEAEVDTADVTC